MSALRLLLLVSFLLPAYSCRNQTSSDLSEVVGRSDPETFKKRDERPFVARRSGPKSANQVFESNGTAEAVFNIYQRWTVYHEDTRTYTDYVWDDTLERASGTEGAWGGYFLNDQPQRDKPELLANAVKGIGKSTAEMIVKLTHQGAPLSVRPKSWDAFKSEMKEIDALFEKKDKYKPYRGLYKNVIMDNGGENIRKLGYQVAGQELKPVQREEIVEWSETKEKFVDSYSWRAPVALKVRGVQLLPTEEEKFTIYVSESSDGDARLSYSSNYGDYQVQKSRNGDQIVFMLEGSRKAARPENKVVANIAMSGTNLVINFEDAVRNQLGEYAGTVEVSYEVRRDTNRWFAKKGPWNGRVTLNGARGQATVAVPKLKAGQNFVVTWTMNRKNSSAYDGQKSSDSVTRNMKL